MTGPTHNAPTTLPIDPAMAGHISSLDPETRDRMLMQLLSASKQTEDGSGVSKIEDANLLLSLRPKVLITEINPRTRRISTRYQDRKQWNNGLFDPFAHEEDPHRNQIIKVEAVPPMPDDPGPVIFEQEAVIAPDTAGGAIQIGSSGNTELLTMLAQMRETMEAQAATIATLQARLDVKEVDGELPPRDSRKTAKAGANT